MIDRRQFLLGSSASAALLLSGCATVGGAGETAQARALYDRIFYRMLEASPEMATGLGLDVGERAHLKARLASTAAANRFGTADILAQSLPALNAIDREALELREQAFLDTARWLGERASEIMRLPYGGMDGYPVPYVITQLTGSYQDVPDFLDSQHKVETAADAEAYLSRLGDFARNVNHEVDRAQSDAAQGVIPPDFILDKAIAQTRTLRQDPSGLVESLVRRTREHNIPGDWQSRATGLVNGPLAQALDRQIAVLTDLRRRATSEAGVSRLPGGRQFYELALRYHTSTGLTPEQAHQIGLQQVAELQAQAEPLLRQEGLTTGGVGERIRRLGQLERFQYPNTDAGRAQILADLNRQMAEVRTRMPDYFNTIPTSPMEIKRVPPAIELGAPRGYAQGPSLDGSRPGAFYINLADTRIWPRWALPTLTYHESIPGHLWQGSIALENETIPLLHRNIGIAAYGEGWGLYSEQLADEIGMYRDYPIGRIGMIQAFLYRAARIVIDTGLHSRGWSRQQAIDYFRDNVGLDPLSAENEVDRYIVWPGQATSYKLGHTEIVRLRESARERLGDRFDIKGFHEAVLGSGDMPLEVLATVVNAWVEQRLRG